MDVSRVENLSHSVTDPQALLNADTFMDCMQALIRHVKKWHEKLSYETFIEKTYVRFFWPNSAAA